MQSFKDLYKEIIMRSPAKARRLQSAVCSFLRGIGEEFPESGLISV